MKSGLQFDLIPDILALVHENDDPVVGHERLLALCERAVSSPGWSKLPVLDVERDVADAARWLEDELGRRPQTTGVYLGLDTLNMRFLVGTNVEIGGSIRPDVSADDLNWLFAGLWYGNKHLIRGLRQHHRVYRKLSPELFELADYVLFLAYSGLVLSSAIARLPPRARAAGNGARIYAWGFHDGDFFPLARAEGDRFERLKGKKPEYRPPPVASR